MTGGTEYWRSFGRLNGAGASGASEAAANGCLSLGISRGTQSSRDHPRTSVVTAPQEVAAVGTGDAAHRDVASPLSQAGTAALRGSVVMAPMPSLLLDGLAARVVDG
jgi:hypothetical protein